MDLRLTDWEMSLSKSSRQRSLSSTSKTREPPGTSRLSSLRLESLFTARRRAARERPRLTRRRQPFVMLSRPIWIASNLASLVEKTSFEPHPVGQVGMTHRGHDSSIQDLKDWSWDEAELIAWAQQGKLEYVKLSDTTLYILTTCNVKYQATGLIEHNSR